MRHRHRRRSRPREKDLAGNSILRCSRPSFDDHGVAYLLVEAVERRGAEGDLIATGGDASVEQGRFQAAPPVVDHQGRNVATVERGPERNVHGAQVGHSLVCFERRHRSVEGLDRLAAVDGAIGGSGLAEQCRF